MTATCPGMFGVFCAGKYKSRRRTSRKQAEKGTTCDYLFPLPGFVIVNSKHAQCSGSGMFTRGGCTRGVGEICIYIVLESLSCKPASNVRNDALFVIVGTATAPYCTHIWNRSENCGSESARGGEIISTCRQFLQARPGALALAHGFAVRGLNAWPVNEV